MVDKLYLKTILQVAVFCLDAFCALIFSILILSISRLRHRNNVFIVNMCFTIIGTSIYFVIFYLLLYFNPRLLFNRPTCPFLLYAYCIASIEIPYAFVAFSVYRLCSMKYHTKLFFKTKKWVVICLSIQWILVYMLALPYALKTGRPCKMESWTHVYTFIIGVVIPSIVNVVLNILIFTYVRSSTRRIRPQRTNASTQDSSYTRFTHRDISLLKRMLFMFLMFIGGWTPAYLSLLISQFMSIDIMVVPVCTLFSEICIFSITGTLFIHSHDVRQFLTNRFRQIFTR